MEAAHAVSTWGSEVVELKEGPLELTLFDVPKDFTRVNRSEAGLPNRPGNSPDGNGSRKNPGDVQVRQLIAGFAP